MCDDAVEQSGVGRPGVQPDEVEVGDRVDLVLAGATSTNHATGTVIDTDRPLVLKNGITVELDSHNPNCDKEYETSVGYINRIIGDES